MKAYKILFLLLVLITKTMVGTTYDADKIRFNADKEFRFLQLTDVHLKSCEGKLPVETDALLRQAFAKYKPSLVVLTGDIIWGRLTTAKGNFELALKPLVDIFREHKVHFCVTFGNHDSEHHGTDWCLPEERSGW